MFVHFRPSCSENCSTILYIVVAGATVCAHQVRLYYIMHDLRRGRGFLTREENNNNNNMMLYIIITGHFRVNLPVMTACVFLRVQWFRGGPSRVIRPWDLTRRNNGAAEWRAPPYIRVQDHRRAASLPQRVYYMLYVRANEHAVVVHADDIAHRGGNAVGTTE